MRTNVGKRPVRGRELIEEIRYVGSLVKVRIWLCFVEICKSLWGVSGSVYNYMELCKGLQAFGKVSFSGSYGKGTMCCKGSQITLLMGIMVKVGKRGHKEQGKYGVGFSRIR